MKKRALIIIGLIFFSSIYFVEASSIQFSYKNKKIQKDNTGILSGLVETQGRCMIIGVPNIKIACGKSLNNYEIEITDENGYFEFSNLYYKETGTKYYLWILPGQNVIFPYLKIVDLNDKNSEVEIYFFVFILTSITNNNAVSSFFNQKFKILFLN